MSFDTVLVANRGEIALRVIEACRELGLRSIAVYSEADEVMPYLQLADGAVCIGPAEPAKSYLNAAAILSVADLVQAGAIHPGYGFLSESPHFVEICEEHGVRFIGPSRATMQIVGDKILARDTVAAAGVPVLPGGPAPKKPDDALAFAESLGYPVLVKSVFGGGGRGLRWTESPEELLAALGAAGAEAKAASGEAELYFEKAVRDPRHVEVQILADERGRAVHLGERDCSVQRRHQKLIEESPAPGLDANLRERLHRAALAAAHAVNYTNVGTVEFLVEPDGRFHFIEMNARIQVEHPVSEVACGVNLVREQIRIAAGEAAPLEPPKPRGHTIECRINAEDPTRSFLPSTGTVHVEELPGGHGVRLDTAIYDGMVISPHYDSLLAKLVVWGEDRETACLRMETALRRFRVSGVATTRDLALAVISHDAFRAGDVSTSFLAKHGLV
ncbi:MAG: biotin carboxylase N-terminal domain-containing protein [Candidatus Bipolaricaulota bacterium]